jgi:predicted small lipoprotein YifL
LRVPLADLLAGTHVPGSWKPLCAAIIVISTLAGCGLKGPLELPERPTNVVIRPAPGTPAAEGTPSAPTGTPPASTPTKDESERLPPPDLPRGQRGGAT